MTRSTDCSFRLLSLVVWLSALVAMADASTSVDVNSLGGVDIKLPDVRLVNGVTLQRNGQGVRRISFFGMDINIYVAGLYSQSPLLSEEDVMGRCNSISSSSSSSQSQVSPSSPNEGNHENGITANGCPILQLEFTFLRSVGQGKVQMAWQRQLDHSVSYKYDGYEKDCEFFITLMSSRPIEYGGTQTVQLIGDETHVVDQGQLMGKIVGYEFQKSFLSMWFGATPVADDLKAGLLSGF